MQRQIFSDWFDVNQIPKNMPDGNIIIDRSDFVEGEKNIFIHLEPYAICQFRNFLLEYWHRYTHIFTYDAEVLKFPNAKKYICATSWIEKDFYENIDISKKQFKISSITGIKDWTIGHRFRLDMFNNQSSFPDNFIWFASHNRSNISDKNPVIDGEISSKKHLFETFQFSLAIENSQQTNYFTEKLLDCLITKTIPIYWGCPNISEYFNTDGWIILDTTDIFVEKTNILDADYYGKYASVIEENYQKAIGYSNFYKNLENAI